MRKLGMQRWTAHARFFLSRGALLALSVILMVWGSARAYGSTPGGPVFSWYMTYEYVYSVYAGNGNAPIGDPTAIAAYKHDIQDAQASGIDGFELFFINRADIINSVSNMFEAAKELHAAFPSEPPFLLFMSPQASGGGVNQTFPNTNPPTNWIVYFMTTFANHPNYYHYAGKPVLGSFLGLDQQSDWTNLVFTPLANQGINVFFVPTDFNANLVTTDGTHFTTWGQANIGSINYWTGSNPSTDVSGTNNLANVDQVNGKPVVVDVSGANYWSVNTSPSAGVYFEHYGGEGPAQEWQNAISLNPVFILETTWNDWTEAYTSPVDIPNVPTVSSGYPDDALLKPHAGYAQLRKYYYQWYKAGAQPAVTNDGLMYFYRIAAQSANTQTPLPTYNPATIPDDLFVTTQLTAPATLSVSTGGNVTTYTLPAGVNSTRIPFSPGAQQFALIRDGITIATVSGEAVLASLSKNNLEYTTGFGYANSAYSGSGTACGNTAWTIPGTIYASNYDCGGEGVGYHDSDPTDDGGQGRTAEGVDLKVTAPADVAPLAEGWIAVGEWSNFSVNVTTAGTYSLAARVASPTAGGTFHVEIDGANVTGKITVPVTESAWNGAWGTVTVPNITLSAGAHKMRFAVDTAPFDLEYFTWTTSNLIANGTYVITSVYSGLAIDDPNYSKTNGQDMQQYTVTNGANQQWTVNNLGNNVITLTNGASGEVLDVAGASMANSALVDQWPYHSTPPNQQWNVISLGGGHYELTNVNSGLALDVVHGVKTVGAQIDQYTYYGNPWQQWIFQAH